MEKTKEIHKALKRRKFVNAKINDIKEAIDRLNKIFNTFENERKILDFELHSWDMFSNKTNSAIAPNRCYVMVFYDNFKIQTIK